MILRVPQTVNLNQGTVVSLRGLGDTGSGEAGDEGVFTGTEGGGTSTIGDDIPLIPVESIIPPGNSFGNNPASYCPAGSTYNGAGSCVWPNGGGVSVPSSPGQFSFGSPSTWGNLFGALAASTPSVIAAANGTAITGSTACIAAGGQWTGSQCVAKPTNYTYLLLAAVGLGAIVLMRGR